MAIKKIKLDVSKKLNMNKKKVHSYIKHKYPTLDKGLSHAVMYWPHSSYVESGYSEEYLENEILYGM